MLILDHERREFFTCPDHVMAETMSPNPVAPIWFTLDGKPVSHDNTGEMQRIHLASLAAAQLAEQSTTQSLKQTDFQVKKRRIMKKTNTVSNSALISHKPIQLSDMLEPAFMKSPRDHPSPKQNTVGISTGESAWSKANNDEQMATPPALTTPLSKSQEVIKSPHTDRPSIVSGSANTKPRALQSSISSGNDASLPPKVPTLKSNAYTLNRSVIRTNNTKQSSLGEERKLHTVEQGARKFQLKKRDLSNITKNDVTSTQAVSANMEATYQPHHTREDRGDGDVCQDGMHSPGTPKSRNVLPAAMESKILEKCTHSGEDDLHIPDLNIKTLHGIGISNMYAQLSPSTMEMKNCTSENNGASTDKEHPIPTPDVQQELEREIPNSNSPFGCKPYPVQVQGTSLGSIRMGSLTGNDVLSIPSSISQVSRSTTDRRAATVNSGRQSLTEIPLPNVIKTVDRQQSVESLGSFNSIQSHTRSLTPNHRQHDSLSPHGTPSEINFKELEDFVMEKVSQNRQSPGSQAISDQTPKVGESQAEHQEVQVLDERSLNPLQRGSSVEFPTSPTKKYRAAPKNMIDCMKQNKDMEQNISMPKLCDVHFRDHVELHPADSDKCEDDVSTKVGSSFKKDSSVHSPGVVNGNKRANYLHFQGSHSSGKATTNQRATNSFGAQLHPKNGDETYPHNFQAENPLRDDAIADWISGDTIGGQRAPPSGSLYPWQSMQVPPQQVLLPNQLNGMYATRSHHRPCQDLLVLQSLVQSPTSFGNGERSGPFTRRFRSGPNESRGSHDVNPFNSLHRNTQCPPSQRNFGHPQPGSIHEGTAIYSRHTLTVCSAHTSDISPVGGNAEVGCDSLLYRVPATSMKDLETITYKCNAKNGGNALFVSWKRRLPLRVFRFTSKSDVKGYRYDGLYSVMVVLDCNNEILTEKQQNNKCSQFLLGRNDSGNQDCDLNTVTSHDLWSLINQGEVLEGADRNEQYHYLGPHGLELSRDERNGMGHYPDHRDQIMQNRSSSLLNRGPTHPDRTYMSQHHQYAPADCYARHHMDILQRHGRLPPAHFDPRYPVMMDVSSRRGFDNERPEKKSKHMSMRDPQMY